MNLVVVVPIKELEQAKSRLGEALDPEERVALAVGMLRRTLRVVTETGVVTNLAVVTPDDAVFAIACEMGVAAIRQHTGDLNAALELGREWATQQHADALLVLPADLPLLCSEDISALRDMSTRSSVVIAPDWTGSGTNALLLRPPDAIGFHFGPGSYQLHLAAAVLAGLPIYTYRSPRTERDLDTPPDIEVVGAASQRICDNR